MPIFISKIKTLDLSAANARLLFPSCCPWLLLLAPLWINMQYPFNQSIKNELLTTRAELRSFFFSRKKGEIIYTVRTQHTGT